MSGAATGISLQFLLIYEVKQVLQDIAATSSDFLGVAYNKERAEGKEKQN